MTEQIIFIKVSNYFSKLQVTCCFRKRKKICLRLYFFIKFPIYFKKNTFCFFFLFILTNVLFSQKYKKRFLVNFTIIRRVLKMIQEVFLQTLLSEYFTVQNQWLTVVISARINLAIKSISGNKICLVSLAIKLKLLDC